MKNMVTLFSSAIFLFSLSSLMAQPGQFSNPGYYSTPPHSSFNSTPSGAINWTRSYADAIALSQSTSKPIVILFTGTGWCPACMKLEREVLNRPEFAQAVGQKFVFLKAEFPDYSEEAIMHSPYKPLVDRYGINAFPTMVIVNASGQQLYTVNYRDGGPSIYAQELLQKLNQTRPQNTNPYTNY